jgi:hypothetical protein
VYIELWPIARPKLYPRNAASVAKLSRQLRQAPGMTGVLRAASPSSSPNPIAEAVHSFFSRAPSFSWMKVRISSVIPRSFSHWARDRV